MDHRPHAQSPHGQHDQDSKQLLCESMEQAMQANDPEVARQRMHALSFLYLSYLKEQNPQTQRQPYMPPAPPPQRSVPQQMPHPYNQPPQHFNQPPQHFNQPPQHFNQPPPRYHQQHARHFPQQGPHFRNPSPYHQPPPAQHFHMQPPMPKSQ